MRKETITYQELSILMYQKDARGVMNHILGRIANYCDKNSLPQLNALVVRADSGKPGRGIPLDTSKYASETDAVYALDWYNVYPPNESELQHSDCLSAA